MKRLLGMVLVVCVVAWAISLLVGFGGARVNAERNDAEILEIGKLDNDSKEIVIIKMGGQCFAVVYDNPGRWRSDPAITGADCPE